jgi:hypothetical protein
MSPMLSLAPLGSAWFSASNNYLGSFLLSNDAPLGSTPDRIVKGHRNGYRRALPTLLHDSVAALLPDCGKSVLFKDATNL